jgi:hypothetical protein
MVFFAPVFFFFIPAEASHFVIPAQAGLQFLFFSFRRKPPTSSSQRKMGSICFCFWR